MDGINGVLARIAEIDSMLASLQPPTGAAPVTVARAGGTGSPGTAAGGDRSFASVLEGAVGRQGSTGTGAAAAVPAPTAGATSGARRADGVPVELASYGNGRIPPQALRGIGVGGHTMWAPAAESFQRMHAAAARDGVTIGVTDSYRSYAEQVDVARRKGLYSQGGLAARPGTSEHGWGLSLDLRLDDRALAWMRAHGAEYGFSENVPREPWHWTFTA